jgi:hypothetical protein
MRFLLFNMAIFQKEIVENGVFSGEVTKFLDLYSSDNIITAEYRILSFNSIDRLFFR